MEQLKDILGREIFVGDTVARAIRSMHTFHKILKLTPKGVKLSRGSSVREYRRYNYHTNRETGRYERDGTVSTHSYTVVGGATTPQEVDTHTMSIYVKKDNISLVLI